MQKVRRTCLRLPVFPYFENIPWVPIADMNSRSRYLDRNQQEGVRSRRRFIHDGVKRQGKGKVSDDANKASSLHVVCSPEFGSRY